MYHLCVMNNNTHIVRVVFHGSQVVLDRRKIMPTFQSYFGRIKGYKGMKIGVTYELPCNNTMLGWTRNNGTIFNNADSFSIEYIYSPIRI